MNHQQRKLKNIIYGKATLDGAGVKLIRSLGQSHFSRVDPFLMLDEFFSDNPSDYIAGFPSHPHRGFETVTYMLQGHMLHEDHMGNKGHLRAGDVQWMTAGRGIIHSEMPQQESGVMHGFQLWINLPAKEKMCAPAYQDIPSARIPYVQLANGTTLKIISGAFLQDQKIIEAPVTNVFTHPIYWDIHLPSATQFTYPIDDTLQAIVYVYEGELDVGAATMVGAQQLAIFEGTGGSVTLDAKQHHTKCLLLAAQPLHEPIVQCGPFVMNTQAEIDQALADYQSGRFGAYSV